MTAIDPMPYIIAAAVIGTSLGYLITAAYYRRRLAKVSKETWHSAWIFYTRRDNS